MNEKKFDPAFIPCGDSMEKISEIDESALESVSGGYDPTADKFRYNNMCHQCDHKGGCPVEAIPEGSPYNIDNECP